MTDLQNTSRQPEGPDHEDGVYFSDTIVDRLHEAAKWARLISFAGFFFAIMLAVFAFSVQSLLPALNQMASGSGGSAMPAGAIGTFMTVYYLFIAILFFLFHLLLFQFAKNLQLSLVNNDQTSMEAAFNRLSAFFKYWGVLTIIILGMLLFSVFGIVAGLSAA